MILKKLSYKKLLVVSWYKTKLIETPKLEYLRWTRTDDTNTRSCGFEKMRSLSWYFNVPFHANSWTDIFVVFRVIPMYFKDLSNQILRIESYCMFISNNSQLDEDFIAIWCFVCILLFTFYRNIGSKTSSLILTCIIFPYCYIDN